MKDVAQGLPKVILSLDSLLYAWREAVSPNSFVLLLGGPYPQDSAVARTKDRMHLHLVSHWYPQGVLAICISSCLELCWSWKM